MEITLEDLERELVDLMISIKEDADPDGRDHWPNGRWPMVHNLAGRIGSINRKALSQ